MCSKSVNNLYEIIENHFVSLFLFTLHDFGIITMAFASNYDTSVTDLIYRIFTWTLDTIRFGLRLEMTILEHQINNQIDIHVEVKTAATAVQLLFNYFHCISR